MNIKSLYKAKLKTVEEVLEVFEDGDAIYSAQAAGEPAEILSQLHHLKDKAVKDLVLNTCLPLGDYPAFKDSDLEGILDHTGWFFSKDLRMAHSQALVSPLPQSSTSVLAKSLDRARYEGRRPIVMATVSPMDRHGYFSLSVSSIYERDLIDSGAFTILEVNPNFPRTFGDTLVHIREVDVLVETSRPIPIIEAKAYGEVDRIIGKNVADLIEDGSTIQLGIGNIPNAIANELKNKKDLGIHSEMFTETMVDLIESGAVNNSKKGFYNRYSVCSFTMGSQRLYDFIDDNPSILFKSARFTNDPYTISRNNKFVSINSSLEIDLMGQCAAETLGGIQYSGTGGHFETVRGAQMSQGGKSIIAMHSSYEKENRDGKIKRYSKIKPSLRDNPVVTTSRNDIDYVVTEYGVAWLRGLNMKDRVEALIKIAHPDFREELRQEALKNKLW